MHDLYAETVALGMAVGILGGALSHATWMVHMARSGKTVSLARKNVSLRIKTFFLSVAIGLGGGFVTSLICYDKHSPRWVIIGAAFAAGYGLDLLVKKLAKINVV